MTSGRPKFIITSEICCKAEELAAQGLHKYQIAQVLGIHRDTLNEKEKEYTDLSDAITLGKAKGIQVVVNALFEKARRGDVAAIKYFLNNRDNDNWNERKDVSISSPEGITFVNNYSGKPE